MKNKKVIIYLILLVIILSGFLFWQLKKEKKGQNLEVALLRGHRTINFLIKTLNGILKDVQKGDLSKVNQDLNLYQDALKKSYLTLGELDQFIDYQTLKTSQEIKKLRAKEWENYKLFFLLKDSLNHYPQFLPKIAEIENLILERIKTQVSKTFAFLKPLIEKNRISLKTQGEGIFSLEVKADQKKQVFHQKIVKLTSQEIEFSPEIKGKTDSEEVWINLASLENVEGPGGRVRPIYQAREETVHRDHLGFYRPIIMISGENTGRTLFLDPMHKIADWSHEEIGPGLPIDWAKMIKKLGERYSFFRLEKIEEWEGKKTYVLRFPPPPPLPPGKARKIVPSSEKIVPEGPPQFSKPKEIVKMFIYIDAETYLPLKEEKYLKENEKLIPNLAGSKVYEVTEMIDLDFLPKDFFEQKIPENYQLEKNFVIENGVFDFGPPPSLTSFSEELICEALPSEAQVNEPIIFKSKKNKDWPEMGDWLGACTQKSSPSCQTSFTKPGIYETIFAVRVKDYIYATSCKVKITK